METHSGRGRLTIYLGYAAGVGKTYKMLDDAYRLKESGADVVIGYFEPHARVDTIAMAKRLPSIPNRDMEYRGAHFREMDTAAILQRRPSFCVVDELAHSNVPGSEHAKRWEDVQALQAAGIHVLTTLNVQHLESLNDQVWQISGVRVRETVPDWLIEQADEVIMVDLTPPALVHRLERGVVYPPEKAQQALSNFFKESTLSALRELAMRQTAHVVEVRQTPPAQRVETATSGEEAILICITPAPSTAMVIRRGSRVADFLRARCYAVFVPGRAVLTAEESAAVEQHLRFARNLRIETEVLPGHELAASLVEFARAKKITQIYIARAASRGLINRIVRLAQDMQVTIVADRKRA